MECVCTSVDLPPACGGQSKPWLVEQSLFVAECVGDCDLMIDGNPLQALILTLARTCTCMTPPLQLVTMLSLSRGVWWSVVWTTNGRQCLTPNTWCHCIALWQWQELGWAADWHSQREYPCGEDDVWHWYELQRSSTPPPHWRCCCAHCRIRPWHFHRFGDLGQCHEHHSARLHSHRHSARWSTAVPNVAVGVQACG